ncbi:MAG: hypothetical protein E6I62_05375 [Chloroflexi bacterium]|nr:MAG: hypothetical protein E6I62_05375 [Chloroflexota bacterium]
MQVRIALAQLAPHLGDLDANLELVTTRLAEGVAQGADIVVFPELALTGYLLQDLVPEVALRADDPRLLAIGADTPEVMVAVGFVEETRARRYCNTVALLRGGRLIGLHRKVYLPTYGLFDEGRFTRAGDQIRATEVGDPLHKVGLSVCEDFWHPFMPMLHTRCSARLQSPSAIAWATRRASRSGAAHGCSGPMAPCWPRLRSTRKRWWWASSRPMTCACSATTCRWSATSGSSWFGARWTGSSQIARDCPRPPSWGPMTDSPRGSLTRSSRDDGCSGRHAAAAGHRSHDDHRPDRRLHPLADGADWLLADRGGALRRRRLGDRRVPGGARGRPAERPRRADAISHQRRSLRDRCAARRAGARLPDRTGRDQCHGRSAAGADGRGAR